MARIPTRQTAAGRAFNDLRVLARREGRPTDEVLTRYVLERWLSRLASSRFAEKFVLKGAMLLAILDARRPTRDADLLARAIASDEKTVLAAVAEIAAIDLEDGVVFDAETTKARGIREADRYSGVRVTMSASVGQARSKLSLDINFGDPVTPGVVREQFPELLGGSFPLLAYPIETVIAEKVSTAIALGAGNTRERDYADLWRITGSRELEAPAVIEALRTTASFREIALAPLSTRVGNLAAHRQNEFTAWVRRQGPDAAEYPASYAVVIDDVCRFADHLVGENAEEVRWMPDQRSWKPL